MTELEKIKEAYKSWIEGRVVEASCGDDCPWRKVIPEVFTAGYKAGQASVQATEVEDAY